MTTIAYRDGVMAGDSGNFVGDVYLNTAKKVFRHKGHLYGMCGEAAENLAFKAWIKSGSDGKRPSMKCGVIIEITPKGKIKLWENDNPPYRFKGPFIANGAGGDIAFGAMGSGATAEQAVEAACKMHAFTVGPVRTVKLKRK